MMKSRFKPFSLRRFHGGATTKGARFIDANGSTVPFVRIWSANAGRVFFKIANTGRMANGHATKSLLPELPHRFCLRDNEDAIARTRTNHPSLSRMQFPQRLRDCGDDATTEGEMMLSQEEIQKHRLIATQCLAEGVESKNHWRARPALVLQLLGEIQVARDEVAMLRGENATLKASYDRVHAVAEKQRKRADESESDVRDITNHHHTTLNEQITRAEKSEAKVAELRAIVAKIKKMGEVWKDDIENERCVTPTQWLSELFSRITPEAARAAKGGAQ